MKAEHRHELKTNELAEWIANFPQWLKENQKTIIYVTIIVALASGSYIWHKYNKNVIQVREQIQFAEPLIGLWGEKAQIVRAQAEGVDLSFNLFATARNLKASAQMAKTNYMAALALIKHGETIRMELHYRPEKMTTQEIAEQMDSAKTSYQQALTKAVGNPTLTAKAKLGLGLCEEELGNIENAKQIYSEIVNDDALQATTAFVQAKLRINTIDDYKEKITFVEPPKQQEKEKIPEIPIQFQLPDTNSSSN